MYTVKLGNTKLVFVTNNHARILLFREYCTQVYLKVGSTNASRLEPSQVLQTIYEGEVWCLCTVTFWPKLDFLICVNACNFTVSGAPKGVYYCKGFVYYSEIPLYFILPLFVSYSLQCSAAIGQKISEKMQGLRLQQFSPKINIYKIKIEGAILIFEFTS